MTQRQSIADLMILTKDGQKIIDKIVVATTPNNKVVAVGEQALKDEIQSRQDVTLTSPFYMGHITDFLVAQSYFEHIFNKVEKPKLRPMKICAVVMNDYNLIEIKAIEDLFNCVRKTKLVKLTDEYSIGGRYSEFLRETDSDILVRIWVEDTKQLLDDIIALFEAEMDERGVKVKVEYTL